MKQQPVELTLSWGICILTDPAKPVSSFIYYYHGLIHSNMKTLKSEIITALILPMILTSCSAEGWYAGAQSAQQAQCMKEPAATYDDCMKQTGESYDEYSKKREELIKENQAN